MSELKLCPYCGSKAGVYTVNKFSQDVYRVACHAMNSDRHSEDGVIDGWCPMEMGNMPLQATEQEAIELWNTRPIEDALQMTAGIFRTERDILKIQNDTLRKEIEELKADRDAWEKRANSNIAIITNPIEDALRKEIEELKFILDKFGEWYSTDDCPATEADFCPRYDDLKKEHDLAMADEPEECRYPFHPSNEDCGEEMQGGCYVEYYRKLFRDKE